MILKNDFLKNVILKNRRQKMSFLRIVAKKSLASEEMACVLGILCASRAEEELKARAFGDSKSLSFPGFRHFSDVP
jgi:hypothetical protein